MDLAFIANCQLISWPYTGFVCAGHKSIIVIRPLWDSQAGTGSRHLSHVQELPGLTSHAELRNEEKAYYVEGFNYLLGVWARVGPTLSFIK